MGRNASTEEPSLPNSGVGLFDFGREKKAGTGGSLKRRSPDEVRFVRASGNEINFGEEIVMTNSSTAVSSVIPFRTSKLLLVERDGQPFVPMKPVVEGMGLAWQTQHRKLMAGRFAPVITMMVTTGLDGKQYEMACLPLKKLPGWLMSIHASKVKQPLRENVLAYQDECDDVLWAYWNDGRAVNHRDSNQSLTVLGQTIGTDGFHMLGAIVKGKVSGLPAPVQRRATSKIWSQVHAAFGVRSAADIPADHLDSARNFVAAYTIEGELLPKREQAQIIGEPFKRYLVAFNHKGEQSVEEVPDNAYVLSQHDLITGMVATPGDIPVSHMDMFRFMEAGLANLKARAMFLTRRAGAAGG
ncbi:phage antirepressor N-terminal domain-containing protein [Pseudomonas sp. GZD-222]|uniref:phage antirepressor N-terminal domain-containing protein n=1 Tax=Pseudomonas sp. GZD-222 TaxID=3404805 RepID=UPI003BB7D1D0